MTRQEKIKAAEERIKELETLIKHLKKQNLFLMKGIAINQKEIKFILIKLIAC